MRIRRSFVASLSICAPVALAQGYPVPGFDCANASTAQELRICRSPQLSALDGRHAWLVERAVRAAPDRDKAIAEMDAWLERVRNPCQDDQCLVDAYTAHIAEIERTVPASKAPPAFTMPALPTPDAKPTQPAVSGPAPSAPRTGPDPEPASDDDDDDDGGSNDGREYAIAAAIALLAVVVAAAMRAGTRKGPRA